MRRIIAILLALLLLGLSCNALAYDEEITFQGIPWGSNHKEVEKLLKDKYGKNVEKYSYLNNIEWDYYAPIVSKNYNSSTSSPVNAIGATCKLKKEKIAGYDVENIVSYYLYPSGDENATWLHSISVTLSLENIVEGFDDLAAKLTDKYGEPIEAGSMSVEGFDFPYYAWVGGEDTFIHLNPAFDIFTNGYKTYLSYTKALDPDNHTYDVIPPEPVAATPVPSNNVDRSDSSGL